MHWKSVEEINDDGVNVRGVYFYWPPNNNKTACLRLFHESPHFWLPLVVCWPIFISALKRGVVVENTCKYEKRVGDDEEEV